MRLIDNQGSNNPRINLALEEFVARNYDDNEDYVILYINRPSIILGKHQNVFEELNLSFVREENAIVARRISGGGTVYHDYGNLNFCFITKFDKSKVNNYKLFNQPIVDTLIELGIPAEMNKRNDIIVEGKKVSGNAQFSTTKKMFSHGTLLFDAELPNLSKALKVKSNIIKSRSVKSVRSKVANLKSFLKEDMTIDTFKNRILEGLFKCNIDNIPIKSLDKEAWDSVIKLSEEKYNSWEWNYGRSPAFTIQRTGEFNYGKLSSILAIKDGKIETVTFSESFFEPNTLNKIKEKLIGVHYSQSHITNVLNNIKLDYITIAEFTAFLCD